MKKLFYFIFFLLSLCSYQVVMAQTPKKFTPDKVMFLKEMQLFLESSIKKDADDLMEKFEPVWQSEKFTAEQQKTIYSFSNDMLRKRMKPFPDFSNYLTALIGFANSGQSNESFKNWHLSLEKGLSSSTKRLSDYIEDCNTLFAKNKIFESPSVSWVSGSTSYRFEFDSMAKVIFPSSTLTCLAKGDSSVIENTVVTYYPNLKKIIGVGGTVNWVRGGIGATEAYANINQYSIDVTGSEYTIDTVTFFYKRYFDTPLKGRFTEKLLTQIAPRQCLIPSFYKL
jgi:hypothetical protein